MRSGTRSLCALFLLGSACSQIIGLGDYDKTDGTEGSGGSPSGGAGANAGTSGSGGASRGGTSTGDAGGGAGGESGSADAGRGGSLPTGGTMSSGGTTTSGGTIGEGGGGVTGTGGLDAGAGGVGGEGGSSITGGTGGSGGTTGGKGGSGGTTGGTSGGKGGSGGTTGGTSGGKGGSGGTTGGTTGGTAGKGGSGGSGGTCSTVDLITPDGNFDGKSGLWIESAPPTICTKSCFQNPNTLDPHSGTSFVWLGGDYSVTQTLDRLITVPVGTSSVVLDCYYLTASEEVTTTAYDFLYIDLVDTDGAIAATFAQLDNRQQNSAWLRRMYTVQASAFTGIPAALRFTAELDDDLNTNFFIDTCALRATVCN